MVQSAHVHLVKDWASLMTFSVCREGRGGGWQCLMCMASWPEMCARGARQIWPARSP